MQWTRTLRPMKLVIIVNWNCNTWSNFLNNIFWWSWNIVVGIISLNVTLNEFKFLIQVGLSPRKSMWLIASIMLMYSKTYILNTNRIRWWFFLQCHLFKCTWWLGLEYKLTISLWKELCGYLLIKNPFVNV